jgi:ATP-dependent protease ClpP protease subunit
MSRKNRRSKKPTPITGGRINQVRARLEQHAAARDSFWNLLDSTDTSTAQLHIYGAIGGYWGDVAASDIVPALRATVADTINVYINSPGGDVYDGIAIRNALRQHSARIVVTVDGLAASAASFIAVAGDEVIMGSNAELMIHDAWTIAIGNAEDFRLVAGDLDRISQNIATMYADKAGGTADEYRALMKAETWYSADDAVAAGLADRVDTDAQSSVISIANARLTNTQRDAAPAPLAPAAMAQPRKDTPMNRAQLAAALAAGTITKAQHDDAIAVLDLVAPADMAPTATVPPEVSDGPQLQNSQPSGIAVNETLTLQGVARRIADAANTLSSGSDPRSAIRNALADVIPADDAGGAFVNREDWLGETFRASDDARPWIDAIGTPEQLTKMKGKGWRWGRMELSDPEDPESDLVEVNGEPEVDEYEGNKTDVPSNEVGTLEETFTAFRIAGGWDVDRAYSDFAEEEFWTAFFEAAIRDYKRKSNAAIRTRVLATATDTPNADVVFGTVGVSGVLKQLRRDVRATAGGHANRIALGDTLYDALEELTYDELPLWLRDASIGLGVEEGSADVGTLHIWNDPALGAQQSVVFDNRGLKIKERAPFWIKAENIPKGGIDTGVFSYLRYEAHDPRLVIKRTYA